LPAVRQSQTGFRFFANLIANQGLRFACLPLSLTPLIHRLSAVLFSYFHKQADRTHALKSRRGYVPAAGAFRLTGYFQGNVMPPIRKQSCKALPGVYAFSLQEQTGVRIIVR